MPLVLEHVSHIYNKATPFEAVALEDISLTVNDGELLALIGHTGSGKSTLAQHLNGLMQPTEGRVLLDGMDINDKENKKGKRGLRFQVGLVFQYPEYQLFEETVEKDIAFGPKNMGLTPDEVSARVKRGMAQVGLNYEELRSKSPFELSGGQMRRVALAGVLAMEPRVLVLDEPTAGLDPKARAFLLDDIRRLNKQGTTVVMISHAMDDVADLAHRIAVMEKGRLKMLGTPEEIFARQQELTAMGLDVPKAAQLAHRLIAKGLPLAPCYRLEDMARQLVGILGGNGHAS